MGSDLNKLLDNAFELHKQGKYDEARVIYEKFLDAFPLNVDALNLYAQLLIHYKEFDNAISIFQKVYEQTKLESINYEITKIYYMKGDFEAAFRVLNSIKAKSIEIYNLLANVALKLGNFQCAIDSNIEILKINPNLYDVVYNVSVLYANLNQIENSLNFALKAFSLNNKDVNLLFHIASLYDALDDKVKMLEYLELVLSFAPENEMLLAKMGIEYTSIKNPVKAVSCYERCLMVNQFNYDALVNLAVLLIDIKNFDYAIELCNRALKIAPENIRSYHSLFLIYKAMQKSDDAMSVAQKMIEVSPENHLGYGCLGDIYFEYVDYNLALESYEKALTLAPDELTYLYNKACCLNILDCEELALNVVDKILSIDADYIQAIALKTFIFLKRKKYDDAMHTYPLMVRPDIKQIINGGRFSKMIVDEKSKLYYQSHWNREDISNKKLLLYNNDGFGDSIMFSRYVSLLEQKSNKLVIETDKNLYDLYKHNFPNSKVVLETDEPFKDYDYTVSSMELLYSANVNFENIPFSQGWLSVPSEKIKQLELNSDKFKVGIFWQGNKHILKNRFVNISELSPLFELSNISFYSLDITDKDEETLQLFEKYNIFDCKNIINNFFDTAAILKNLDLLITVDSSVVHLAGALGIKTFLLLPNNPEWRWFNDNDKTPWYDSVRIFKQEHQANWEEVILRIKKELQ